MQRMSREVNKGESKSRFEVRKIREEVWKAENTGKRSQIYARGELEIKIEHKASMTGAMGLLLLVLLSLLAVCIQGARISCARVQAVNGVDLGLYSLFAQYDSDLLQDYSLFFLDGGFGEGELRLGQVINQMEHFAQPAMESGLTHCKLQSCGIQAWRLATDRQGEAVKQQIVRYMKDNLGNTGIEILRDQLEEKQQIIQQQNSIEEGGLEEAEIENQEPMEEISESNNPLEIIKSIRDNGFLGLVLPSGDEISQKTVESGNLASNRSLSQGMGSLSQLETEGGALDKLLIQEYILQKLSFYTEQRQQGGLDYQAEYVLGGKDSDKENLQYTINRLLLLRETANIAFLYTSQEMRAQLSACAAALSFLLLIPEGMSVIQGVLAAGWAYVESICDVKTLLSGGKIPLIKDNSTWKTQLKNLAVEENPSEKGMSYREYLFLLLSFSSTEKLTLRCMDMIEQNIRQKPGKEKFSLDACLDALSVNFLIEGPEEALWEAQRFYTYDM